MKILRITLPVIAVMLLVFSAKSKAQDSLKYKHVLIVSYNPDFYLSDAEQEIMEHTGKTPDEYRNYLRNALDLRIQGELESVMHSTSMLQDTSIEGRTDLEHFYAQSSYAYSEPNGLPVEHPLDKKGKEKPSNLAYNQQAAPQYLEAHGDEKFLNNTAADPAFLKSLMDKNQSDLIISINQFEIKTNYNSCLDIANHRFRRELILHYNIMNKEGKSLQGNYERVFMPSDGCSETEIASRCFPDAALFFKKQVLRLAKK